VSRNLPASIRARLNQHADATKEDFNLTLTHFGLERLLYRLSISRHANNYLLKGALLFSLWYDQPQRPTRDADLLGFGPDDVVTAVAVFQEICRGNLPAAQARSALCLARRAEPRIRRRPRQAEAMDGIPQEKPS
jgi:hypothetical protein